VVDDDITVRMSVSLASDRIEVIEASRRREGLAQVRATRPDAVVIDRRLPDGDGLALVAKLRAEEAYRHLPIVVMTAGFNEEDRAKVMAVGATDFVTKPFDPEALVAHLEALVQQARAVDTAAPPPPRRRPEPLRVIPPPSLDELPPPPPPVVPPAQDEAELNELALRARAGAADSRATKALVDAQDARKELAAAARENQRLVTVVDGLRAELDQAAAEREQAIAAHAGAIALLDQAIADRDEATDLTRAWVERSDTDRARYEQLEDALAHAEAEIARLEDALVTARDVIDLRHVSHQLVDKARKRLAPKGQGR
jgi:DNA-binding response OmpR family regulator